MEKTTLSLQASEQALVAAASRIYAAYIVSGRVFEGREKEWMSRAIKEAIWIARNADEQITSEGEMT